MGDTKILIAENHVGTARELSKQLSELEYQPIAVVTNGERVLLKVEQDAPDLILIAYRLPGNISAVQVARQIRAKGIPTIFILNKADDRLFQQAGITQTFDYILKPYDKRQLNLVIDAALYRRTVESKIINLQDYHTYLHESNQILWDWDYPSGIITINAFTAKRLGLSAQTTSLPIEDWYQRLHNEDVDIVRQLIDVHLRGETSYYEVEHRLLAAGEKWIWVYSRGKVVEKDENQAPIRMLSTSREITYQKKAELDIQDSAHRLRLISENMADIVGEIDSEGIICYISPSISHTLGYSQEQVLSKSILDFIYPDDQVAAWTDLGGALSTLSNDSFEVRVRHLDGRYIWFEATLKSMNDAQENSVGVIFSLRDITQRRESEEALKALNERLTEWINDLERRNLQMELLNEMGEWLQGCRDPEEAYSIIAQYVEKIFWDVSGAFYKRSDKPETYKAIAIWGDNPPYELVFSYQDCWSLRRMRAHIAADPSEMLLCPHIIGFDHPQRESIAIAGRGSFSSKTAFAGRLISPHLCVPVIIQGEARGVMHLSVREEQSIRHWEQLAITLAERIGLALANLELQETLRFQAIRDPLTGLFNRRYMEETLSRELRRSMRFKRPLGIIMLDIDRFKRFNDDYSYAVGDLLLQALGEFLQDSLRHGDVVCRYGGEEFILILPEASLEDTCKRAEHIREGVTGLHIQHRGMSLGTVTISLGVAAYPEHGDDPESLLQAVDTALHSAKRAGRNRLVVPEA